MVNLNYISLKERIKGANCELKKKIKKSFEGIFARSKKENTIKQAKTIRCMERIGKK